MSGSPETSTRIVLFSKSGDKSVVMTRSESGSKKFFGGRLEVGENPMEGVIRELLQEGGVDLSKRKGNIIDLPYQNNDPMRPSHWFASGMDYAELASIEPQDDALEVFLVHLDEVAQTLTYPLWQAHWNQNLLPILSLYIK